MYIAAFESSTELISRKKAKSFQKTNRRGGLLYAPERWSNNTISAAIRNAFYNIAWEGTELNSKYVKYVNTSDLLDFSREKFDKAIKTAVEKQIAITSKYAIIKLRDVAIIPSPLHNVKKVI